MFPQVTAWGGVFGALIGSLLGWLHSLRRSGRLLARLRCRSWRSVAGFAGSWSMSDLPGTILAWRCCCRPHENGCIEGQQAFGLDLGGDKTDQAAGVSPAVASAVVTGTRCEVLWQVLTGAYARLGFGALGDEAFAAMVLARIVEPVSKLATIGVLEELGVDAPHRNTLNAALKRFQARDYLGALATACMAHFARTMGRSAMVLYDVTTLHLENKDEDDLRKVGMSKEHRIDPQVQVGLLVDPGGFPLEVQLVEGNKAETTTLIPVLTSFQERHKVTDMVVVADAGMLSAANLNALEDAGFSFIVGSRLTKAPYDLAAHFQRHDNHFEDGQIRESIRSMGTGKAERERRIVYQWWFKRQKRDDRNINLMIEKAGKIAAGKAPLKKARFLKVTGAAKELDRDTIARARQVEASFRMMKKRSEGPACLPPSGRSHRSPPHRGVRCLGPRPPPAGRHWRHDQETRPCPTAAAHRDHQDR